MEKLSTVEKELIESLIERGYIKKLTTKYTFTPKFNKEFIPSKTLAVVGQELALVSNQSDITPEQLFAEFIKVSKVPTRCPVAKYWLNRFNKPAAKEFYRILTEEEINLNILIHSTTLYYIQTKEYANTIANYILNGVWRTGYMEMIDSVNKGTIKEDVAKALLITKKSNTESI